MFKFGIAALRVEREPDFFLEAVFLFAGILLKVK